MAKKPDKLAGFEAEDAGGVLGGLLAEENEFDRRTLWRIASWGAGATGAVIVAIMANQSSLGIKRDHLAAADLTRQAQQIQLFARETQNEARRLAAAIDTLNNDRDRLFARVTGLEHGLDSATGTVARQGSAGAGSQASPQASPQIASVSSAPATSSATDKPATADAARTDAAKADTARTDTPRTDTAKLESARETVKEAAKTDLAKTDLAKADLAKIDSAKAEMARAEMAKADAVKPETAKPSPATPLVAAQSMMAPPDPAASKLVEPGKAAGPVIASPIPDVVATGPAAGDVETEDDGTPKASLRRTEFGVDLGTANSVNGLRMLWLGLLKSRSNAPLAALRPIIVVKESAKGLGMQLRLVAGPLHDAGAAARICAILSENKRPCETAIFDGQRLSLKADDPSPAAAKPPPRRRSVAKRVEAVEEAAKTPEAPPSTAQAGLTTIFNRRSTQ